MTLAELEAEESRLWTLFEAEEEKSTRLRAEWLEVKHKADDARLVALIEARLQDRLRAMRRTTAQEDAEIARAQ